MIAATFLAIFFVPMFFRLVTRAKRVAKAEGVTAPAPATPAE
jgi:hypothetical protein